MLVTMKQSMVSVGAVAVCESRVWCCVLFVCRAVVTWYMKPWCLPDEIMTDMYYPIYAEGLYDALMQVRDHS